MAGGRRAFGLLAFAAAGCTSLPGPPPVLVERPITENWQAIALADDLDRHARLDAAWAQALATARAQGQGRAVDAAGPVLDPGSALPRASPPPGPYRCRVVRLGAGPRRRALTVYPAYFCHIVVEGELLVLTKQDGPERLGGYLYPDADRRLVFLGATASGAGPAPPAYGESPNRNMIGRFERIGPLHYRLVVAWPRQGATLDVLELVPIAPTLD